MSKINVWVLDPDVNKRRIDSRVLKILRSGEDTIYVEDPWFFIDFGHINTPSFKRISDYGDINVKHTYKDLISLNGDNQKIGFVINPKCERALDYLKGRKDVVVRRVI